MGLVEIDLEVCERLVPLWFLSCLNLFVGETKIGERCWSGWRVIECELGVALWLVRWCSGVAFDWCVRFSFCGFLAVVVVFFPFWTCLWVCAEFSGLFCWVYDGGFQVLVRE